MRTEYYALRVHLVFQQAARMAQSAAFRVTSEAELYALRLLSSQCVEEFGPDSTLSRVGRTALRKHAPPFRGLRNGMLRTPGVPGQNGFLTFYSDPQMSWAPGRISYDLYFPELPESLTHRSRGDNPHALPARLLVELMRRDLPLSPVMDRVVEHSTPWGRSLRKDPHSALRVSV